MYISCQTCNARIYYTDYLEHASSCRLYQLRLEESRRIYRNSQIPAGMNVRSFIREHFQVEPEREYEEVVIDRSDVEEYRTVSQKEAEHVVEPCDTASLIDWACAICLEELEKERALGKLGCGHVFCRSCIIRWLGMKNTCPMCKKLIRT